MSMKKLGKKNPKLQNPNFRKVGPIWQVFCQIRVVKSDPERSSRFAEPDAPSTMQAPVPGITDGINVSRFYWKDRGY